MARYFTEEHEWIDVEGDSATVGITDYAQGQLGDIVFIELPDVGDEISAGADLVTIESVKAASDIAAPLDGEITEVNEAIVANPASVNEDPTGEAWFFKMKIADASALDELMNEDAYKAMIGCGDELRVHGLRPQRLRQPTAYRPVAGGDGGDARRDRDAEPRRADRGDGARPQGLCLHLRAQSLHADPEFVL